MKYLIGFVILVIGWPVFANDKIVLQLKWFHQFQFAGYYAAIEQGYYRDVGLDVKIRQRDRETTAVEDVLNGIADYGIADSSIVVRRMKGEPVVIASTIFQASPLVFLSLAEQNIKNPYDLAGKRIMFQRGVDGAPILALLKMYGIKPNDYTYVRHNFDDFALLKDRTDVMSAYRSNQPLKYRAKNLDINIIDPSSYGVDFYGDLIFTTEAEIKNNLPRVKRFVSASIRGWLYALENQREIAQLIIDKYGSKSPLPVIMAEAEETATLIKHNIVELGTVFPQRFEFIGQTYRDLGMVDNDATIDGLFLTDYEEKPLRLKLGYVLSIGGVFFVILAFLAYQKAFNKKLKKLVEEQTLKLESNNDQLLQNLNLLEKKNKELAVAKYIADKASSAKSSFLANMSHEIRTPMNGILGTLQMLKQQPQSPEGFDLLDKASYSARTLLTILNDILDFSKIEAGKLSLELVPFEMDSLIASVEHSLQAQVIEKSIDLKIEKQPGYHNTWLGDPVRIKQVILNIVSNAVKFTEKGEVIVKLGKTRRGELEIKVADTGIGMSEEHIDNLFKRFEQADKTTTRKFGGTGLGMAISKSLVDLMAGKILVESRLNQGTEFTIRLPLEQKEQLLKSDETEALISVPDLSHWRAVLAEDNKINQSIFRSMMRQTGAELEVANDGEEAVELILANQPDIVFMDIQMPVMDGIEACNIVKQQFPELIVVAVTANVMDNDIAAYLDGGFDFYLAKPIDLQQLYQICEDVQKLKQQA